MSYIQPSVQSTRDHKIIPKFFPNPHSSNNKLTRPRSTHTAPFPQFDAQKFIIPQRALDDINARARVISLAYLS